LMFIKINRERRDNAVHTGNKVHPSGEFHLWFLYLMLCLV
jgi:hypothetical protein